MEDLNLDMAALEQFAAHLEANEDIQAASVASVVAHNSNNNNISAG